VKCAKFVPSLRPSSGRFVRQILLVFFRSADLFPLYNVLNFGTSKFFVTRDNELQSWQKLELCNFFAESGAIWRARFRRHSDYFLRMLLRGNTATKHFKQILAKCFQNLVTHPQTCTQRIRFYGSSNFFV